MASLARRSTPLTFFNMLYIHSSLISILFILLAKNYITVPYLSPLSHHILSFFGLLSPLKPFIGPLGVASVVLIWQETKPDTTSQVMMVGMIGHSTQGILQEMELIVRHLRGEIGWEQAWKGWVECLFLVWIICVLLMGWRVDGGLVGRWWRKKADGTSVEREMRLEEEGKESQVVAFIARTKY